MPENIYQHPWPVRYPEEYIYTSVLGTTSIHFIEPGVKVNGQYYREDLLMQKLLPDIRQMSDFYVFQQDSEPAHRARTIELLTMEIPEFIPPKLWPCTKQSGLKTSRL